MLAEHPDVEEQDHVQLSVTLPTNATITVHARVARLGRGRMLVEVRNLPEQARERMAEV